MKIRTLIRFCLMIVVLSMPMLLWAQGDPGDDPDPAVPFDGGLSLLIAAGVGYAAKKGYDKRKKNRAKATQEEQSL